MEWLIYLSKVSACLALFYAFYFFFLQRLTFFNANRYYLLATLIISAIIPSLDLQIQVSADERKSRQTEVGIPANGEKIDQVTMSHAEPTSIKKEVADNEFPWRQRIVQAYWLVAAGMFAMFLFQLSRILWYTRHVDQRIGRLRIVYKHQGFTNCSFFNYVFLDQKGMTEEEISQVLKHELVHVSGAHSIDRIISGLFKIILWFNPLVYLYDHALEQVHEYEADRQTSSETGNTLYAKLLLSIAVKNNHTLVHSFSKGQLKKRITMLFSDKSKGQKRLNYFVALPLVVVLGWSFGIQIVYAKPIEIATTLPSADTRADDIKPEVTQSPNMLKKDEVIASKSQSDSLLMIDYGVLGEKPEVLIDGKIYPYDILYRISPRCIISQSSLDGKLVLNTLDKKIEYATKIDRENKRTQNIAKAIEKFYARYTLKNQDGSKYDEVMFRTDRAGSGGTVTLKKGSKVLFTIDDKSYPEDKLGSISIDTYKDYNIELLSGIVLSAEEVAKYGTGYNAIVKLSKRMANKTETKISEPEVTYIADSVALDQANQIVTLFGKRSKLVFGYYTIKAGQITYNSKT
ncbi:MAG: M56 family metallopeptidase, partial [Pedobacter sp.]